MLISFSLLLRFATDVCLEIFGIQSAPTTTQKATKSLQWTHKILAGSAANANASAFSPHTAASTWRPTLGAWTSSP